MAEENKTSKEEKKIEVPAKFKDIVEKIEKMTVADLSELVKILEEKFGVSAQTPVVAAVAGAGAAAEKKEEQTTFNVELTEVGGNKISVIKAIREIIQGIGLKEAKDLVDAAPKVIKEGAGKEEAEEIKKKLEAAGAKVTLK
ncbi:50S ribosomal protein L7/L12 [bacterium]|nr:50S ribosomal protein L7/L12 [bacterium]